MADRSTTEAAVDRRLAAILALAVVPWSVVFSPGEATLVFAFALVDPAPLHVTDLYSYTVVYTRGLPWFLLAWPIGAVLYVVALLNAALGRFVGREDRRVTAALLVFAALTQVTMAVGFSRRLGYVAVPVGTVLALAVVWWFDADALRSAVGL